MNINNLQNQLQEYENKINESEKRKANLEGKQESLLEKLKTEFQIVGIDEIDSYISKLEKESNELEEQISENLQKLEEYDMED